MQDNKAKKINKKAEDPKLYSTSEVIYAKMIRKSIKQDETKAKEKVEPTTTSGFKTIAVTWQFYVGSGYRRMSESMDAISADINLLVEVLTHTGGVKEYEISPDRSMPIIR